mmetsp:Transcript_111925/g.194326  ORF Transcript_111925/g.194326 Transcript_111925/m.194326 type:complete len:904 (-) Transcript_111925:253-2964(-)
MTETYVGMTLLEERVYSGIAFESSDNEKRLWMQEHILGTLVPALQELIQAVRMKQEEEEDPNAILTPPIQPIDWLASLLMRNNPKYNLNTTCHPYYQMLQEHVRRVRGVETPSLPPTPLPEEEEVQEEQAEGATPSEGSLVEPEAAPAEVDLERQPTPEPLIPDGLTDQQKAEMWAEMQAKKAEQRMESMAAVLEWLHEQSATVTEEGMAALYDELVERLRKLMDGVAAYIAIHDAANGALKYRHVSSNCSPALLNRHAALRKQEHPSAPSFQALEDNASLHIPSIAASKEVVHVGSHPEKGDGDMFVGSIVGLSGASGAVLICDSLICNPRTISPQEAALFGPLGHPREYRPITEEEQEFLQQVVAELSGAQVNASATATMAKVRDMGAQAFNKGIQGICQCGVDALATLLSPTCNIYVSVLESSSDAAGEVFCVVAQVDQAEDRGHSAMLGKVLRSTHKPNGLAFALREGDGEHNLYYVPNTLEDPTVAAYGDGTPGASKPDGSLVVVGIRDSQGQVVAVLGVEDVVDGLYDAQLAVINTMADTLSEVLAVVFARKTMTELSQQALEWIGLQTGLSNLYVSLIVDDGALRYIAASPANDFLLGKLLPPDVGLGISHQVLAEAKARHVQLAEEPQIHFWDESRKGEAGEALLVPITVGDGSPFGLIGADTLGNAQAAITPQYQECITKAAEILAAVFAEVQNGVIGAGDDTETLAIETAIGARAIRFLKKVWLQVRADLEHLAKNEISELAGYKAPPDTITSVTSAAMIVAGSKPSKVSEWAQCRPKIKAPWFEKIIKMDPTKKGKKAKYIRAKKMLKGLTVDTVHTKGSLPASLLYEWTNVMIQLRYAADALRKRQTGENTLSPLLDEVVDLTKTIAGETEEEGTEDDAGSDEDASPDEAE